MVYSLDLDLSGPSRSVSDKNDRVPYRGYSRVCTRQRGPCLLSPLFFMQVLFAVVTLFDIEPQKRSRATKFGTQMQHRVIQRVLPPSRPQQSQIACASVIVVAFNNSYQAISGRKQTTPSEENERERSAVRFP